MGRKAIESPLLVLQRRIAWDCGAEHVPRVAPELRNTRAHERETQRRANSQLADLRIACCSLWRRTWSSSHLVLTSDQSHNTFDGQLTKLETSNHLRRGGHRIAVRHELICAQLWRVHRFPRPTRECHATHDFDSDFKPPVFPCASVSLRTSSKSSLP